MPRPSSAMGLTGRTDYRIGWFGKVILMVEISVEEKRCVGLGFDTQVEARTYWRDAVRHDVFALRQLDRYERNRPNQGVEREPGYPMPDRHGGRDDRLPEDWPSY